MDIFSLVMAIIALAIAAAALGLAVYAISNRQE